MKSVPCPVCKVKVDFSDIYSPAFSFPCPQCGTQIRVTTTMVPEGKLLSEDDSGVIRVACPYCDQHHAIGDDWKQDEIICQECGRLFLRPDPSLRRECAPAAQAAQAAPDIQINTRASSIPFAQELQFTGKILEPLKELPPDFLEKKSSGH